MQLFVDSILYSYAQIFFSNRRWFGAVVLAGTFVSPQTGLVSLLGVVVSNLAAYVLKFDEAKIKSGFYGFNGILFGAAAAFYFEFTPFLLVLVVLFIIITFFVSAVLEHLLASMFNLPGLSLPFVISLYIFIVFLTNFKSVGINVLDVQSDGWLSFAPVIVHAYFKSLALIVFQPNAITGVLLALSLLALSRVMFILSLVGFVVSHLTLHLLFDQPSESLRILAGFNSILTAFALGGNLIIPSRKSLVLTAIASVVVVIMTGFFVQLLASKSLPVLVLPFNAITLSVIYSLKFRREQSGLVLLYFMPGTPEENFYYHHNRLARFDRFKAAVPELPFFGVWNVSQGHDGNLTHKDKWRFAWDFVVVDEKGSESSGAGTSLKDYYCYGLPVLAPLDGSVVRVVNGIPENPIGEMNLQSNWGNSVVVDHGGGLFSSVSHLEQFSIKVSVGDRVRKGDALGACGNSGRSPTPHLHLQFQATDKVGDKTVQYPIGQFLRHGSDALVLQSFEHPQAGARVQNVILSKPMKKAFDFTLGDRFSFQCKSGKREFVEAWEVKVDIYNNLYIESTVNATVTVTYVGNIFYLTNFVGNRKSALYHFYLTAVQVPLCHEEKLVWHDEYPLSRVLNNQMRYISESFLLVAPQLRARATFGLRKNENSDIVIRNHVRVEGRGFFASYERAWKGTLVIGEEGSINEITVTTPDDGEFTAIATISEDEQT